MVVKAHGLVPIAEIAGIGWTSDAHHFTRPHQPTIVRAIRQALDDAEIDATAIGSVNAHGTSTPTGDGVEVACLREIFGDHLPKVPISANKSQVGHSLGAAAAVEAVLSVMALQKQFVLPHAELPGRPRARRRGLRERGSPARPRAGAVQLLRLWRHQLLRDLPRRLTVRAPRIQDHAAEGQSQLRPRRRRRTGLASGALPGPLRPTPTAPASCTTPTTSASSSWGRASLLRDAGFPLRQLEAEGYGYPICQVGADFFKPVDYDAPIFVHTRFRELRGVRVDFDYLITHAESGAVLCQGFTRHAGREPQRPSGRGGRHHHRNLPALSHLSRGTAMLPITIDVSLPEPACVGDHAIAGKAIVPAGGSFSIFWCTCSISRAWTWARR